MRYIRYVRNRIKLILFKIKWRKWNSHNQTSVGKVFEPSRVKVGRATYGQLNVHTYDKGENLLLSIGDYCSIAGNVQFLCGGDHYTNRMLTFPVEKKLFGIDEALNKGTILVEDDVWIGSILLCCQE